MADLTAVAPTTEESPQLDFYQHLEEVLAVPEPMCLGLVQVGTAGTASTGNLSPGDMKVVSAVHDRLRSDLRGYDMLARVEADIFLVVLRTLAGTTAIEGRMRRMHEELTKPYELDGQSVVANVVIGAAVREPSERPSSLLRRADEAVVAARSQAGHGPVVA